MQTEHRVLQTWLLGLTSMLSIFKNKLKTNEAENLRTASLNSKVITVVLRKKSVSWLLVTAQKYL